jgi:mannose-6-phosphate isomerase-like protein (cupin superfamily)
MALTTHDLALALRSLGASAGDTALETAVQLDGFTLTLIRLAAGQRYELEAASDATLLVLEGMGTIALDDWRATLGGGHIASVPARKRLKVSADGGAPMSLLITRLADAPTVTE